MDADAAWAEKQFGQVELEDKRRKQRAVDTGQAMTRRPGDDIIKQMGDWAGQGGAYQLPDKTEVSHTRLSRPHWQATREQTGQRRTMLLMVQDSSELDYNAHEASQGLR